MKRSLSSSRVVFAAAWLGCASAAGFAAFSTGDRLLHETVDYTKVRLGTPGTELETLSFRDEAEARTLLEAQAKELARLSLSVRSPDTHQESGGEVELRSVASLGVQLDLEQTLARLERAARRERLRLPWLGERLARTEPLVTVPPVLRLDEERLSQVAEEWKLEVDRAPHDARIDLDAQQIVAEQEGRLLDVVGLAERALSSASAALCTKSTQRLELPTVVSRPRVTRDSLEAIDISEVVAEFETRFSRGGEQARRGANIDIAAAKLDGLVINPGEIISFNQVVGARSEENGFQKSWEIFKGEMVEGIGGGTCQVSSTFHAAAFFGGLEVIDRSPHSRPSAYITMGLDSTVVWPNVDLKLKNPYPFPVIVHTKTSQSSLRVELLGKARPVSVRYSREVQKRLPFSRRLVENPSLSANKVVHKQHGIDGYRIKRFRSMQFSDGTSKVEETTDYYPPTADIFEVPVGFDERRLPQLAARGDNTDAAPSGALASVSDQPAEGGAELQIVEGKGAHRPSRAQQRPEAKLRMGE